MQNTEVEAIQESIYKIKSLIDSDGNSSDYESMIMIELYIDYLKSENDKLRSEIYALRKDR